MTDSIPNLIDPELGSHPEVVVPPRRRIVDRMDPTLVNVLTGFGFGLPVFAYFYILARYSLNVIVGDQWDDVTVINRSYSHLFDWGSLWALHNENRIFFPNLIVILLAHTTHFNIQVEEYLSAVMLVVATGLLMWAHKRRSPSCPWLYYCPVAFLALSVVQWQNTLWGFQMAWYLVVLSLAIAVVLLDRVDLSWPIFACAVAAGVVGSFSSLQGLLIWPAGLILIYHRRRVWSIAITWIAFGATSIIVYFHNFTNPAGSHANLAWQHPLLATKFYLVSIGDILGLALHNQQPNYAVMLFGLLIVLIALAVILAYGILRDEQGGGPIGIALICFGLLFAATVTQGRIAGWYAAASQSRYTTFDLLALMGIYLALLGRTEHRANVIELSADVGGGEAAPDRNQGRVRRFIPDWAGQTGLRVTRWAVLVAITVQIVCGLHYGLSGAKANYEYKVESAKVLRNIDHTSNEAVVYYLYVLQSPSWIRQQARIAEQHHLSLFDDG